MDPIPKQKFDSGRRESSATGVAFATDDPNTADVGYQAYASESHADLAQNGTWGPTLPRPLSKTLPFVPENVVFLGSPIGMFLTLRGAHPVFDALRKEEVAKILKEFEAQEASTEVVQVEKEEADDKKHEVEIKSEKQQPELPFASPFSLPVSGSIYNIFHPSDPVAYRIEPLLVAPDMAEIEVPQPVHLTVEGEGLRVAAKAEVIGGAIASAITNFTSKLEKLGKSQSDLDISREIMDNRPTGPKVFPLGGKSKRVDFQLQRNVVDPEYLSAVTAHSTYFVNTDVQDFVMNLAAKSALPEQEEEPATLLAGDPASHQLPDAVAAVINAVDGTLDGAIAATATP